MLSVVGWFFPCMLVTRNTWQMARSDSQGCCQIFNSHKFIFWARGRQRQLKWLFSWCVLFITLICITGLSLNCMVLNSLWGTANEAGSGFEWELIQFNHFIFVPTSSSSSSPFHQLYHLHVIPSRIQYYQQYQQRCDHNCPHHQNEEEHRDVLE